MSFFDKLFNRNKVSTQEETAGTPAAQVRDIASALARGQSFFIGEVGAFDGCLYESRFDGNCWTPTQHPAVWILKGRLNE